MSAGSGPRRRDFWQARANELDRARERGEIGDDAWFAGMAEIFETAYLEGKNPRAQSGFGGNAARWEAARRPIADVIDRAGSFLDVGCASGHLLESVVRWSAHRVEPYGLELSPGLAELARRRLPRSPRRRRPDLPPARGPCAGAAGRRRRLPSRSHPPLRP